MNTPNKIAGKVRVGIYSNVANAEDAVSRLLNAGYVKDQISVICSDQAKEQHFREFEHQDPAGTYTPAAVITGGAIGLILGGLTTVAGVVATGGIALLAAGGLATWAGGVVGGLIGAMMTRGVERELADFYDQAVVQGKILVAAEVCEKYPTPPLLVAEEIFAATASETVELLKE